MGSNNPGNSDSNTNNSIAGALTYPDRGAENVVSVPVQPRQPRNLQGLLRFAMEATKAEDAPGNSDLGPMDEERRKFLEEALKSLTVNMATLIQDAIKVLSNQQKINSIQLGQTLPEDVRISFNNLLDYIDDLDIANDFYKMGGFAIFPICLGSENDEVRALACSVLAELCQNNPYCQARALECGLLNVLINLLASERGTVLSKCLYAVSCASREHEPACRELIAQGGPETLTQLLSSPEPSVRTKAAFLIRYLCYNHNEAKEQFIQNNLVAMITEQIKAGRDETTEHLLSVLLCLVEGLDPTVLQQCRNPAIRLKQVLEQHLKHPDLISGRFSEEKEYCQEVLRQVFQGYSQVEPVNMEDADR